MRNCWQGPLRPHKKLGNVLRVVGETKRLKRNEIVQIKTMSVSNSEIKTLSRLDPSIPAIQTHELDCFLPKVIYYKVINDVF